MECKAKRENRFLLFIEFATIFLIGYSDASLDTVCGVIAGSITWEQAGIRDRLAYTHSAIFTVICKKIQCGHWVQCTWPWNAIQWKSSRYFRTKTVLLYTHVS